MKSIVALFAAAGMLALVGCQDESLVAESEPQFNMVASHDEVLVGETVTFTTQTSNTLGREAEIQWHSSAGQQFQTSADKRVAQVTFDRPGTYIITADLLLNGNRVSSESQTIVVKPVRTMPTDSRDRSDAGLQTD